MVRTANFSTKPVLEMGKMGKYSPIPNTQYPIPIPHSQLPIRISSVPNKVENLAVSKYLPLTSVSEPKTLDLLNL